MNTTRTTFGFCIAFTWNLKLWLVSIPWIGTLMSENAGEVFLAPSGFRIHVDDAVITLKLGVYRVTFNLKALLYGEIITVTKPTGDFHVRTSDGEWILEHRVTYERYSRTRAIISETESYFFKQIPSGIKQNPFIKELERRESPIDAINSYCQLARMDLNFTDFLESDNG